MEGVPGDDLGFEGALGGAGGAGDNSQPGQQEQQFVVQGLRRDSDLLPEASGDGGVLVDDESERGVLSDQERFLPIANVARIMKKGIPSKQGKIARDARECVQECVSEFISFITSEASDRCQAEKRKTINGEDILFAMSNLGFENYVDPLKAYLQKYRESNKGEKQPGEEYEMQPGEGGLQPVPQTLQQVQQGGGVAAANVYLTYDASGTATTAHGSIDAAGNFRPM